MCYCFWIVVLLAILVGQAEFDWFKRSLDNFGRLAKDVKNFTVCPSLDADD